MFYITWTWVDANKYIHTYIYTHIHMYTYVYACIYIVVCAYLSGKELHRQIGVGIVAKSGSQGDVMVSTLAWNTKNVRLISTLGTIFSIFITVSHWFLYKVCAVWLLNLPGIYIRM